MADRKSGNPFELKARDVGPDRPHPSRIYTAEEQEKLLTGYLEIAPEFWPQIRYGTHMRYKTKKNEFRSGGFVMTNPFDTKPNGEAVEKRFFRLQNGFNAKTKNYQQWLAAYEDVAQVFVKPDAATLMIGKTVENAVKKLNENIRKLADHAKKLEARIAELSDRSSRKS